MFFFALHRLVTVGEVGTAESDTSPLKLWLKMRLFSIFDGILKTFVTINANHWTNSQINCSQIWHEFSGYFGWFRSFFTITLGPTFSIWTFMCALRFSPFLLLFIVYYLFLFFRFCYPQIIVLQVASACMHFTSVFTLVRDLATLKKQCFSIIIFLIFPRALRLYLW